MLTMPINQPELFSIEIFRIALSEATLELRKKAILSVKNDVLASRIEKLNDTYGSGWMTKPENAEFVQWIASSSVQRHQAAYELMEISRRYDDKNERKLNIAEHIGKLIWDTIQDGKFEGVQTDNGVLQQVRDEARAAKVSGARDKDTVRKIWNSYRGVVHLGMAIDYCEKNSNQNLNVLHLAELFRKKLSENCPKGTSKPYVDPSKQISFLYISMLTGPRFRDRGLPFGIS